MPYRNRPLPPTTGAARLDLPRRTFLRSLVGAVGLGLVTTTAVAGCDPFGTNVTGGTSKNPLDGFLRATVALGDRYDATIAALPALTPLLTAPRDAHRAHAKALAQAIGGTVPTAGSSPPPIARDRAHALSALVTAEKSGRDEAVAACLAAGARTAPLLGSIAAARASHLEILK